MAPRTIALLLITFLFIAKPVHGQLTDTFKKIDLKNSFKDVVFGSKYLDVNKKMKLTKRAGAKNLNRYNVTAQKYLSVGIYKATDVFVEFSTSGIWVADSWSY